MNKSWRAADVPVRSSYIGVMTRAILEEAPNQLDEPPHAVTPEKRRRVGRPPRNEPVKIVSLSVPETFHKTLSSEAKSAGMRPASYILARLLQASPPSIIPALNVEQWSGLRHLLEEIAKELSQCRKANLVSDQIEANVAHLTEEVRRLRLLLLGIEAKNDPKDPKGARHWDYAPLSVG